MSVILAYDGKSPRLAPTAWIAPGAIVVGDVEIGEDSSIWFQTVVRGDVNRIRIGARTNVQDHSMVHVTGGTVKDRCLVGIGAIVLDGAVVESESMVGAGALVPPGMVVPSGKLVLGAPARVKRDLTPEELAFFRSSAARYAGYAARYREGAPR